jgi:hypothetical protein
MRVLIVAILLPAALGACRAVITPPVDPAEPVAVFIVDEGRHAALWLPRDDGSAVQFAYGEWKWFAQDQTQWWRAPLVMLLPHEGTLARSESAHPQSSESLAATAESVIELNVERVRVRELLQQLEARFQAGADTRVYRADYDLWFVRDDESYWMIHECNAEVVQWVRQLGCRVRGSALMGEFVLHESAQAP